MKRKLNWQHRGVIGGLLLMSNVYPVSGETKAPAPFGPLPSEHQLAWHDLEYYAFLHFTVNTFTDKEWGYGDEDPEIFDPAEFDADRMVKTLKDAGMKAVILTAKHHDGFCLWPSRYTEHSIKNSPYKNGKGDIVGELQQACRKHGLQYGLYLSPWDRNHAEYGNEKYLEYYRRQLDELLSEYGHVFEYWFDGANGGDGFYGGKREERRIDRSVYYRWPEVHARIFAKQPHAILFSDAGPGCRWVGNESGVGAETNWATMRLAGMYPGGSYGRRLTTGDRDGTHWVPAEVDVSIRPGWFYHADEDAKVKSLAHLLDIYYSSVGNGGNLLLNIPPDRRGRIHEVDRARLMELRKELDLTFNHDLALGAKVVASSVRGNDRAYGAGNVTDGKDDTYWATDDDVTTGELVVQLPEPVSFNRVRVEEFIELGQRVEEFLVDARVEGEWIEVGKGATIGPRRVMRTQGVVSDQVRLRIASSRACPLIRTFELYQAPAKVTIDTEQRSFLGEMQVALSSDAPQATIYFTLDGSEPTETSARYETPVTLTESAKLRAVAWLGRTPGFPVAQAEFTRLTGKTLLAAATVSRDSLEQGLTYAYYEGGWQSLRQMSEREPVSVGQCDQVDIGVSRREEHMALKFEGYIDAPADGIYSFFTESDDGSALSIDGQPIVNNDFLQGMTERGGEVPLAKGLHKIEIQYFNARGDKGLTVRWLGPGVNKQEFPATALYRAK